MPVIAVTRAGRGDVYTFGSVLSADSHPIVQFGDAVITSMAGLRQSLTMHECALVAEKIGDIHLADEIRECPTGSSEASSVRYAMEKLWERLTQRAPKPPTDHAEILKRIIADRIFTRHAGIHLRPRGDFVMTESQAKTAEVAENAAEVTENTAAAGAEAPKEHRPIPRTPTYADTSVIKLLADKDGKVYGPENNPKKPGSASADRFAKYVDGMTVKAAKEAGIINGDFANDTKKAFIEIV